MRPDDITLKGQVALVTGGARGIGEGVALTLAEFGADLAIADILSDVAEQTAEELRKTGRRVTVIPVDVRQADQVEKMVAETISQLGRLDILVNNAGGTFRSPFLQVNPRGFHMMVDLNLTSVWVATQAAARYWIENKIPGRVINVSSTEGLKACPGFAAYSAAKAGVINLTKTLSAELGPYGIRINCIAPDYTDTQGTAEASGGQDASPPRPQGEDAIARRIPLQRRGVPEDMAGPVLFFASGLSDWVTGQTLVVDGGAWVAARVEGAFLPLPQDQTTR